MPVHREAVFVQVDARECERCGQVETVAAHAAAQVVNFRTCAGRAFSCVVGCIVPARPQVRFPAPDILRGALFQRELVAQEERTETKLLAELGHERHVVHDGGSVFVAVARLVERSRNLQCIPLACKGFFYKALDGIGSEQIPRLHGVNLNYLPVFIYYDVPLAKHLV